MAITPHNFSSQPVTQIQLFDIEVDTSYKNIRYYTSLSAFMKYFQNENPPIQTYSNLMYIRKNGFVDIPLIWDDAKVITYCRYDNQIGTGWEYAFVIKKEFINGSMTRLYLQYDVWTNYVKLFLSNDSYNQNLPEGITVRRHFSYNTFSNTLIDGESSRKYNETVIYPTGDDPKTFCVVVATYKLYQNTPQSFAEIRRKHQMYDDLNYCFFPYYITANNTITPLGITSSIQTAIRACSSPYTITSYIVGGIGNEVYLNGVEEENVRLPRPEGDIDHNPLIFNCYSFTLSHLRDSIKTGFQYNITKNATDYKILTRPYTDYILCDGSNNNELCIEHISGNTINIEADYVIDSNSVYVKYNIPYLNISDGYNAMFTDNVCEIPRYTSDIANYLTNHGFSVLSSVLTSALNVTSSPGPSIASIGSTLANVVDRYARPPVIKNNGSIGNLSIRNRYFNSPVLLKFSMFDDDKNFYLNKWLTTGYPCYESGLVRFRTRTYYNYIKTQRICFSMIKDNEDKEILENAFNNGVTLWHYSGLSDSGIFDDYKPNSQNTVIT